MSGLEKPPLIVMATWPLVNGCPEMFTPGMPRVVASFNPSVIQLCHLRQVRNANSDFGKETQATPIIAHPGTVGGLLAYLKATALWSTQK